MELRGLRAGVPTWLTRGWGVVDGAGVMMTILPRSHGKVIGFETSGTITMDDEKLAIDACDRLIAEHGKINVLVILDSVRYESLKVVYTDLMWALRHIRQMDRLAVVGDSPWEKLATKVDSFIFGEKYFDKSQLEEAWRHVEGG
jgi:hypothetical protein